MVRVVATCVLGLGLVGCKAPPEAPAELNDLSRYLYRAWDDPDPAVREAGVANLVGFLEEADLDGSIQDRSWTLDPLQPDDVATIERPDRPLDACVSVGVAHRSPWPQVDHARAQTEADQRPFEKTAPDHYDRFFLGLDDPSCFHEGSCDVMETYNEATRKNLLLRVTFELWKNFRWVELEDGRTVFYSRSWFKEPWEGEKENTTLWQSYSIDVWIPDGDGGTIRYQTLWSESDVGLAVTDDQVVATVKSGTASAMAQVDDAIEEQYHAE